MTFKILTILESIKLRKKNLNKIDFIIELLSLTTTMDKEEILKLPLTKSLEYCIMYIIEAFGNPLVSSSSPISFLLHEYEDEKIEYLKIGKYRFDPALPLENCKVAEGLCVLKGHTEFFGLYLLSAGCKKGVHEGIETIINLKDDKQNRKLLEEFEKRVNSISSVHLSFDDTLDDITLVTNDNKLFSLDDTFFFIK